MSKFNSAQTAPRLARSHIAMSLLLAFTTWSGAALADGADAVERPIAAAPESTALSDIVVTATRKETRLQSTPVAMSVIGEEFRRTQNVVTARDLAGQIPGLYTAPSGITPLTNTFFIRGIGNSDPIFDPTVASVAWSIPVDHYGTLKLGGSGNYETSFFSDTINNPQYRIAAHGFANAFVNFATSDRHWNFTLTARNLTNSFYYSTLTPIGAAIKAGPYAGTLLLQGAQNPPRTIFFKVGYTY